METQGWLLDVYPLHDRMILWVRTDKRRILERLAEAAVQKGFAGGYSWDRKKEFWGGQEIEVLALHISDYDRLPALLRKLPALEEAVSFFNCDLPLSQYYL